VCCSIRTDPLEAITKALDRPQRPEYVLLETSGVANPAGVAVTFTDTGLRDRIRLDSIVCVMDAEQVFAAPEPMKLKLWQIGFSDLLILNKVDLVGPEQIKKIKAWLKEHFDRYRLIESKLCDVPMDILLSVGRFDAARSDWVSGDHDERGAKTGIVAITIATITRIPSAPGPTRRTSRYCLAHCGKPLLACRQTSTVAKAWFTVPNRLTGAHSYKSSGSGWTSRWRANGVTVRPARASSR
jgi:G3E family GTPase